MTAARTVTASFVQSTASNDTQAPTAPPNPVAQVMSTTQITLRWGASTDNVGVNHYDVFRNDALIGSVTEQEYFFDISARPSTTYKYVVKAVDAAGNASPASSTLTAAMPSPASGCVGAPNTPGGPDPWGGCWPGPHNTGVPIDVVGKLTDYTGPTTISNCGVVIDSKIINSDLLITASNGTHSAATPCVTIKNSKIVGPIHIDTVNQGPLLITDSEIAVNGGAWWASVGFYNTFGYRLNSHGGHGTLKCQAYCEYHDSWIHGMHLEKKYHYNAIGSNGNEVETSPFVVKHNYMDCGGFSSQKAPEEEAGCTSDLGLLGDYGPASTTTVSRNFFAPAVETAEFPIHTQPGYCFSTPFQTSKPYNYGFDLIFTENIFAKGPTGKCGVFGPVSGWTGGNGNVWSGNKWDDGTTLNP